MRKSNQLSQQKSVEELKFLLDQKTAELELKNRDLNIEAALECVRARTMAMHKSDELGEVSVQLYKELRSLGFTQFFNCGYVEIDEENKKQYGWTSTFEGAQTEGFILPLTGDPVFDERYEGWKHQDSVFYQVVGGKKLKNHIEFSSQHLGSKQVEEMVRTQFPDPTVFYCCNFKYGYLHFITDSRLSAEDESLLARFTKVFDQTYTRFLDLKQAEAQAREVQIELALERVRAKTMAMQHSNELLEAANILFNQIQALGIPAWSAGYSILAEDKKSVTALMSSVGVLQSPLQVPLTEHKSIKPWLRAIREGVTFFTQELDGKEIEDHYKYLSSLPGLADKVDEYEDARIVLPKFQINHLSFFSHGFLMFITYETVPEAHEIFKRFAKVFEQTYTRFLDLQKAEAQAREAQIEAALERVRARTMGMHKSEELAELNALILQQIDGLKVQIFAAGIHIADPNIPITETWIGDPVDGQMPKTVIDHSKDPLCDRMYKGWKAGELFKIELMESAALQEHFQNMAKTIPDQRMFEDLVPPDQLYFHLAYFSYGFFVFTTVDPCPDNHDIFKRFAKVFEQTYTRFLDLQKAEAQAREAQIEAALERIRSKALAMQSSSDLHEVSIVLREQMGNLGQEELESSIVHLYNQTETLESWYTFRSTETNSTKIVTDKAIIPVDSCDYIKETIEKYNSKETDYTIISKGKKLAAWYNVMVKVAPDTIEYNDDGKMIVPDILYYHHSKFSGGALLMISNEKPSDEVKELQKRAANVFNLAYQRFLDLQQAEARTKETIKQASLDRVRGEIASMRSKDDLSRITPLIWQELTTLTIPFIRCGVLIMDEKREVIQSYLSAPDGHSLGVYDLPYESKEIANGALEHWRKGTIYIDHWTKDQFIKFMQNLLKLKQIENPESYQGAAKPPESLDLHFVPFKQGMLYVGDTAPLSQDELQLVQSLAEAFSVAYARYEDFTQLEAAKNQTEQTLDELKSTQSQLIHAEKMASLGELTAGIAHEIQNPLNFVNNFSEVSAELVDEMNEEIESGNINEVKEIAGDLKQNLEKIYHHGNRASGIVKGMLEHSRSSDKKKVLTDINQLADEYLRLAYHGLRAKDKTFNAEFITEFDKSLPKINVISQDIGRVFLNLINNAFYAVNEKQKELNKDLTGFQNLSGLKTYKPTVSISTKLSNQSIEISVKDNGNGIPADIKDKIFQPFFTTKPTGQGTGLGLSLSYDIITKGHDGHMEVETEKGQGAEFTITLHIQ